jgi:lipopolysaccharide transport system permease protein
MMPPSSNRPPAAPESKNSFTPAHAETLDGRRVVIYKPNLRAQQGWITSTTQMLRDCKEHRELILQLFKRDYLMMHKKSFLGMGWHIAAPIMGILSWVFMNATNVLNPGDVGIPYPAYVLISTTIWGFFMASFTQTSEVLQIAQGFIHQVGFPHHTLILKQWLQTFANFAISIVVTIVLLALMGVYPSPLAILFPLALLPILLLGSAVGIVTSVFKVVAPDIQKAITFAMGLWMFLTPVIFSSKVENEFLQSVMRLNPMSYLLGGARSLFIDGSLADPALYSITAVSTFLLFIVVIRMFYVSEQRVIEKMI